MEWTTEELALFSRLKNSEIAALTGLAPEEVMELRLEHNQMRNNWPELDPERAA
ncbi:hypothetical protein [Atlantibacter subterraneus]|uniref:hypothetical protein n=1 Tax=Atlantibacter subterraneus TaxID=255519 RepID=UPI00289E765E|nr:hypothetical protein [Atlantibacter subterranea]